MAETVTNNLIKVSRAAKLLKVSKMTIYRWAEDKLIESQEVDGVLFIPQKEVERIKKERAPSKGGSTGV